MPNIVLSLGFLAGQNHFLAYFIFYLAVIFLGSIAEFTGFWLVFKGFFGVWGILIFPAVIILSSVTGDVLWYSLGRGLRETWFGNFVKNRLPGHEKIEKIVQKNHSNWIFAARFVYASAFPILFSIGWTGMEFKKLVRMSFISILVWVPVLTGIAYGLTLSLTPLESVLVLKKFEIVFLIGIAGFMIINYFVTKLMRLILRRLKLDLTE